MSDIRRGSVFRGGVFGIGGRLPDPIVLAGADFRANVLPGGVTFTRASGATFFDSAGVLQEVGVDVPRFDHNPTALTRLGLLIESTTTNENTNPRMEGAVIGVIGSGGALPTGFPASSLQPGCTLEVVSLLSLGALAGLRLRLSGTPTATGNNIIRVSSLSTSASGTMTGTYWWRRHAGSFAGFSTVAAAFPGQAGITALPDTTSLTRVGHRATISVTRAVAVLLGVTASTPIDITMDVYSAQLEFDAPSVAEASSLILPPVSSPAVSTRAADVASYAAPNGTYDELIQDTVGGEWRIGVTVTGGSRAVTPIAGRRYVRRVRLFAPGTATANPGWAVAA